MKKFVAFVLAMVMVFSLAMTAASAADRECAKHVGTAHHSFSTTLSTDGVTYRFISSNPCGRNKRVNDQRIYVYHGTSVGVADMTNHFLPYRFGGDSAANGTACDSKWVTPELKIPIRSDNTKTGTDYTYNVKARGNTDHALSGYTTISVSGYFSVN